MRAVIAAVIAVFVLFAGSLAQQTTSSQDQPTPKKSEKQAATKDQPKKPAENAPETPESSTTSHEEHKPDTAKDDKEEHYDMTEVAPTVTW